MRRAAERAGRSGRQEWQGYSSDPCAAVEGIGGGVPAFEYSFSGRGDPACERSIIVAVGSSVFVADWRTDVGS